MKRSEMLFFLHFFTATQQLDLGLCLLHRLNLLPESTAVGRRRGELLAVRLPDIDLTAATIQLRRTKNGKPRPAFLNDMATQVLASLEIAARQQRNDRGLLFPDITPAQVTVAFVRACRQAGIEDFSLHDLRHTFASHARMSGVDLHVLQLLLGHTDARMTAGYSHLSETTWERRLVSSTEC